MAGGAIANSSSEPSYTSYGGDDGSTSYEGGDTIVVNGESEPVAQYAEEAQTIAGNYDEYSSQVATPPTTQSEPLPADVQAEVAADWKPMGIYAITEKDSTGDPTRYVQIVISKSGAVGGELHDLKADTSTPIQGAIDSKTQRVAWKVGTTDTTMETGLSNLTQSETPVLIHHGTTQTEQLMMARIEQPTTQP
jgi:hypothetical protein